MTKMIRTAIFWLTLFALMGFAGWSILKTEQAIAAGETVYVELAPVDPRSLIQGDYMTLGYNIPNELDVDQPRGQFVIKINENKTASFVRVAQSPQEELAPDEHLINFQRQFNRWRGDIVIGTDAFFFQEGTADVYENARYGEFRVAKNGTPILVGLRDVSLQKLEPAPGS